MNTPRPYSHKRGFLAAIAVAIPAMLIGMGSVASVTEAQDFEISTPLTSLPTKGTATYNGMFALTGYTGVTGTIQVYVDFASQAVSADLTIPSLTPSGGVTSPPVTYNPTGLLTSKKKKHATYTLTQGVSFSADDPYILLTGSFTGSQARETSGSFSANFCVSGCDTGIYVVRSVTGTFSAATAK